MFVTKTGLHLPFSHYLNPGVDEEKLVSHVYKFKIESNNPLILGEAIGIRKKQDPPKLGFGGS